MNKLIKQINKIPKSYFSLTDIRKISNLKDGSLKVALSRLVKCKDIIRLAKNLYTTDIVRLALENLAVNIYRPSYVSFEYALNYYNILSQQTNALTLATSKRRKQTKIGNSIVIYRHLKPDLMWGYIKKEDFLIAEPEKAFLDLAYLSMNGYAHFDPDEMNINILNRSLLKKYLKKINNSKLNLLIKPIITA